MSQSWKYRLAIQQFKEDSQPYVQRAQKAADCFTGEVRIGKSIDMTQDFYAVAFLSEFSADYWKAIMESNKK